MRKRDVAVVLAAHGSSKDVRVNQPMFELAERIHQYGQFGSVTPAFLDGQPSVKWILDEIRQDHVVVVPFMTSRGYYTDVIFPKHLNSTRQNVTFTPPIGVHEQLANLVAQDLAATIEQTPVAEDSLVIVVGHGTRRNKKSCLTTINLAKALKSKRPGLPIKFAFIDQRPYIDHVFANSTSPNIMVVPFLMGVGPHATVDVPEAFGGGDLTETILSGSAKFPLNWQTNSTSGLRNIYYARPIGTYRAWAKVCIELASNQHQEEFAA